MAAYLMLACNVACTFIETKFEKEAHVSSNRLYSYGTLKKNGANYQTEHCSNYCMHSKTCLWV